MADPTAQSLEYAPRGLIGLLTPQANTTVEPEFAILTSPGVGWIAARLVSGAGSIEARGHDYLDGLDATLDRFANAPLGAYAFAYTGGSYELGAEGEDALIARIETARGRPFVTAARAIADALRALGAARIGLVSPYPPAMTDASVAYWGARGFTVAAATAVTATGDTAGFHPIYALTSADAQAAMDRLGADSLDAILLLGTGMPSLAPIARAAGAGGPPVLSSNLALAWRAIVALGGGEPDRASLEPWITAECWRARLAERLGG